MCREYHDWFIDNNLFCNQERINHNEFFVKNSVEGQTARRGKQKIPVE